MATYKEGDRLTLRYGENADGSFIDVIVMSASSRGIYAHLLGQYTKRVHVDLKTGRALGTEYQDYRLCAEVV
jgi:hypothetical protein